MAENRVIKFVIKKGSKRPKALDSRNTCFQIFSPESIKIRPGEVKTIILNYSIHLPQDIHCTFIIAPRLGREGLQLIRQSEVNTDTRISLDLFNKTLHSTFTLTKKSKIALFMTLNEESAGLKTVFCPVNTF